MKPRASTFLRNLAGLVVSNVNFYFRVSARHYVEQVGRCMLVASDGGMEVVASNCTTTRGAVIRTQHAGARRRYGEFQLLTAALPMTRTHSTNK